VKKIENGYDEVLQDLGIPLSGGSLEEVTFRSNLATVLACASEHSHSEALARFVPNLLRIVCDRTGLTAEEIHQKLRRGLPEKYLDAID